jgi:hypothetical protein
MQTSRSDSPPPVLCEFCSGTHRGITTSQSGSRGMSTVVRCLANLNKEVELPRAARLPNSHLFRWRIFPYKSYDCNTADMYRGHEYGFAVSRWCSSTPSTLGPLMPEMGNTTKMTADENITF